MSSSSRFSAAAANSRQQQTGLSVKTLGQGPHQAELAEAEDASTCSKERSPSPSQPQQFGGAAAVVPPSPAVAMEDEPSIEEEAGGGQMSPELEAILPLVTSAHEVTDLTLDDTTEAAVVIKHEEKETESSAAAAAVSHANSESSDGSEQDEELERKYDSSPCDSRGCPGVPATATAISDSVCIECARSFHQRRHQASQALQLDEINRAVELMGLNHSELTHRFQPLAPPAPRSPASSLTALLEAGANPVVHLQDFPTRWCPTVGCLREVLGGASPDAVCEACTAARSSGSAVAASSLPPPVPIMSGASIESAQPPAASAADSQLPIATAVAATAATTTAPQPPPHVPMDTDELLAVQMNAGDDLAQSQHGGSGIGSGGYVRVLDAEVLQGVQATQSEFIMPVLYRALLAARSINETEAVEFEGGYFGGYTQAFMTHHAPRFNALVAGVAAVLEAWNTGSPAQRERVRALLYEMRHDPDHYVRSGTQETVMDAVQQHAIQHNEREVLEAYQWIITMNPLLETFPRTPTRPLAMARQRGRQSSHPDLGASARPPPITSQQASHPQRSASASVQSPPSSTADQRHRRSSDVSGQLQTAQSTAATARESSTRVHGRNDERKEADARSVTLAQRITVARP